MEKKIKGFIYKFSDEKKMAHLRSTPFYKDKLTSSSHHQNLLIIKGSVVSQFKYSDMIKILLISTSLVNSN